MPAQRLTVARTDLRDLRSEADPDRVLADGAGRANAIAAPIMDEIRRVVGFWRA